MILRKNRGLWTVYYSFQRGIYVKGMNTFLRNSPKGTSVLTLNQSLSFSKIGVCFFFENRSLYFWKSEFVFFLKIGVCFLKTGVCSEKNRSYFWKIGVCSFQNRSMLFENPSIGPRFCAVILLLSSNKISGIARGGAGGSGPPLFFDQTEAQKNFLETVPLLISGSGWPPPPSPLSEGLLRNKRPGRFI